MFGLEQFVGYTGFCSFALSLFFRDPHLCLPRCTTPLRYGAERIHLVVHPARVACAGFYCFLRLPIRSDRWWVCRSSDFVRSLLVENGLPVWWISASRSSRDHGTLPFVVPHNDKAPVLPRDRVATRTGLLFCSHYMTILATLSHRAVCSSHYDVGHADRVRTLYFLRRGVFSACAFSMGTFCVGLLHCAVHFLMRDEGYAFTHARTQYHHALHVTWMPANSAT